jgi:integrase
MTDAWAIAVRAESQAVDWRDRRQAGLVLRVEASGRKTWVVRYVFDGRERRFRIGPYPDVTLARARKRARAIVGRVSDGVDPQGERTQRRAGETVEEVAAAWLKAEDTRSWRPRSRAGFEAHLRLRILPRLGRLKLAEVRQKDVQDLLDDVERVVTRNRTLETAGMLFAWGVSRGMLPTSPCAGIAKLRERPRTRTLTDAEIRQVLVAFDGTRFGRYVRLLFLTGARRDEALRVRRSDVDVDRAVWTVPPDVEKSGETRTEARKVALSAAALELLAAQAAAGGGRAYYFTGPRGERLNRNAPKPVIYRLKGMSDNGTRPSTHKLAKPRPAVIPEDFRLHDIRRTVADRMLNDLGLSAYAVDVGVLGHAKPKLLGTYAPGVPLKELRAAMETWAAELGRILAVKGG